MIDTSTAAHIWADRFDGLLDDVFELQDKVASGVVGAIEPKLRQSEIERAVRKPTESLDAYDLYLRALALRDSHTDDSVSEAITLSKQALVIDDPGEQESNHESAQSETGGLSASQSSGRQGSLRFVNAVDRKVEHLVQPVGSCIQHNSHHGPQHDIPRHPPG